MWALIFLGWNITFSVPGFESKELCDAAGKVALESSKMTHVYWVGCVQQSLGK